MRMLKLWIYSTFAFMLYFFLSVNLVTILYPIPETKTVTVKKIDETIYHFTPKDDIVTSKFYNDEGYFLVVYNEKSKDFDIIEVEEEIWKNKDIDRYY